MKKCGVSFKNKTNINNIFCLCFLTLLEFYAMRKMKSADRQKKKLFAVFFPFGEVVYF
jgi:hypothetical protein